MTVVKIIKRAHLLKQELCMIYCDLLRDTLSTLDTHIHTYYQLKQHTKGHKQLNDMRITL